MELATITYEVNGPIATLSLNRPEQLNALNQALMADVSTALSEAKADGEVRVLVINGAGRCFSSGFDVAEEAPWAKGRSAAQIVESTQYYMNWELEIFSFPKPTIASVHSYCLGGACEVAMLCDITVASADALFGEPEIRFSTGPPTLIMPWIIGIKATKELLLEGKLIGAERAHALGMVNEVCAPEELEKRTLRHALTMTKMAPEAVRLQKAAINGALQAAGLASALQYAVQVAGLIHATETEEMRQFDEIRRDQGLKAALSWRDEQFREVDELE